MDQAFRLIYQRLAPEVKALNFLVALGTHPPMTEEQIYRRVGITQSEHQARYPKAKFFNHLWKDPKQLCKVGSLTRKEIAAITNNLFEMDVTIACNKMVMEHDLVLIVGPVFPHEVVGFSGGNKYIFPGVAGQEIINFFHWLGAVITNPMIIGNKYTPVRAVVDKAAALLKVERKAFCMVVAPQSSGEDSVAAPLRRGVFTRRQSAVATPYSAVTDPSLVVKDHGLAGLFAGTPEEAWSKAADLSAAVHVQYTHRLFHTVLSCAPEMYDDLWTGGKCMYKIEPVVADGGKVIIYAPHIKEISSVHGKVLHEIGYHTRDFFVKQWEKYKHHPWGILAHSTHVKGIGTYEDGVEKPRVNVILATGIPEETCRTVNLGYMDWKKIKHADFEAREEEGILCVPKAGEILYRGKENHGLH